MSDPISISAAPIGERRTREAIATAAERTGVDFDYLLAQAKLESALDPGAKARTSSATGLYQFIDSTWLATLDRHGDALGMGQAAAAIETRGGRASVDNPAQRQAIMALRYDPQVSALMAGALANDNRATLTGVLGREPDHAELYLAHFLGAGGASLMLGKLQNDPDQSAAALLPGPAAANRAIFYTPGGQSRSVGGVMQLIRDKMERASDGSMAPPAVGMSGDFAQAAGQFRSAAAQRPSRPGLPPAAALPPAPPSNSSMADTLRSSFALTGRTMPEHSRQHVETAYARLKAFNL